MACNHNDKAFWIGKADGIYCKECGAKIDPAKKAAPVKKAEPAAEPKKAPAKKTAGGTKRAGSK